MARSNEPIEPMDLANMRQLGVLSLDVTCLQRRHQVIANVDHLRNCGRWDQGRRGQGLLGLFDFMSVSVGAFVRVPNSDFAGKDGYQLHF